MLRCSLIAYVGMQGIDDRKQPTACIQAACIPSVAPALEVVWLYDLVGFQNQQLQYFGLSLLLYLVMMMRL